MGDDFGFGGVGLETVGGENGAVIRLVRGAEARGLGFISMHDGVFKQRT